MRRSWAYIRRHRRSAILVALVAALAVASLFFALSRNKAVEEQPVVDTRAVKVASVAALTQESTLTLTGEVRSESEAELRAETGGQVTGVYVKAGQYVGAGTILAETENASQRAAVLSAQGSVAAARASLAKIQGGARTEDRTAASAQEKTAQTSLEQAKISAVAAYTQSLSLVEDAVLSKSDNFFDRPLTVRPSFRVKTASYNESLALEQERVAIADMLNAWSSDTKTNNAQNNPDAALANAQDRIKRIKRFLDNVAVYINQQKVDANTTREDINADQAVIALARSGADAALAAVTGARGGLAQAQSGAVSASTNVQKIKTGAQVEDIQTAQAGLLSAQGGLAAAVAQLEHTRVRTPIAGTVSNLSIRRGDFVSPMQTVAVVSNKSGLEIETFVSQEQKSRVIVGGEVLIDGIHKGVVTSVEPGLDPVTKKSRVHVGFSGTTDLIHGQFAEVVFLAGKAKVVNPSEGFYIPITAIKVLPDSLVVFTVSASSTLVAHPVEEGSIVGDTMLIKQGLTADMKIVLDARGHNENDLVEVTEQ